MIKINQGILYDKLDDNLKVLVNVTSYKIGAYTFDVEKMLLTLNDESVKLTRIESYLLILFANNERKMLLRKDILTSIWNVDTYSNSRSLDVYIFKLRKLLSKDSNIIIVNIHDKGYRMIIDL